jgi:hypothetical protein
LALSVKTVSEVRAMYEIDDVKDTVNALLECPDFCKALENGVCLTIDNPADAFNHTAEIDTTTSIFACNVIFTGEDGEKTCWAYNKKELLDAGSAYYKKWFDPEDEVHKFGIKCRCCEDADCCGYGY